MCLHMQTLAYILYAFTYKFFDHVLHQKTENQDHANAMQLQSVFMAYNQG